MIFFCTTDTTDKTIWKPSLRKRGFLGLEFRKYEAGVAQFGIFEEGGGGFSFEFSEFQREDGKSFT